jgi:hypothetical protein
MPSWFEEVFADTFVPVFVAVTSTPETSAPVESVTVPVIEARLACAHARWFESETIAAMMKRESNQPNRGI